MEGSTHQGLGGTGVSLGGGELLEGEAGSTLLAGGIGDVEVAGLHKLGRDGSTESESRHYQIKYNQTVSGSVTN